MSQPFFSLKKALDVNRLKSFLYLGVFLSLNCINHSISETDFKIRFFQETMTNNICFTS